MLEILAVLSASAAAGMRIALPLLVIGLMENEKLWSRVPLLSAIHPQVVVCILVSWSLFELFASKQLLGQRVLQSVQLIFSPIAGAILGITVARFTSLSVELGWLAAIVGGLLALVLQLVQTGWFYRLRGLPIWLVLLQDILCICLVIFAFDAPNQGGLIALLLLWLAIRSSKQWYDFYHQKRNSLSTPQKPD
jgi:hypothetical protein